MNRIRFRQLLCQLFELLENNRKNYKFNVHTNIQFSQVISSISLAIFLSWYHTKTYSEQPMQNYWKDFECFLRYHSVAFSSPIIYNPVKYMSFFRKHSKPWKIILFVYQLCNLTFFPEFFNLLFRSLVSTPSASAMPSSLPLLRHPAPGGSFLKFKIYGLPKHLHFPCNKTTIR